MDLTNPKNIIKQLNSANLRTKKYWGQHFIISAKILDQIIKAAGITKADRIVEIGPGLGALTLRLADRAESVVAIEKDQALIPLLRENLDASGLSEKVAVVNQDALKFRFDGLSGYKLVANLPYQITSKILWRILHETNNKPSMAVLMVQKEVAGRLLAKPGDMSLLGVMAQYYGQVSLVTGVKASQFFPPPQVDSAVVRIDIIENGYGAGAQGLFSLVKTGFASRRKKLINNLSSLKFKPVLLKEAFRNAKISHDARAQELPVADWIKLYESLYNKHSK